MEISTSYTKVLELTFFQVKEEMKKCSQKGILIKIFFKTKEYTITQKKPQKRDIYKIKNYNQRVRIRLLKCFVF